MPNVHNLAFGPLDENKDIDDIVKLQHKDHSKVFSTIVFEAFTFLNEHRNKFVGIDGSTTSRAYMYYRCIQNNYDYLTSYFSIYGVNYYARIFRNGIIDTNNDNILRLPTAIKKGQQITCNNLYN